MQSMITYTKSEYWIKRNTGKAEIFSFSGVDVNLRSNHKSVRIVQRSTHSSWNISMMAIVTTELRVESEDCCVQASKHANDFR